MAGHSKWHQIKRSKGALDKKKGAFFTKLARNIQIAAKEGGGDASMNPALKLAIDKAKAANMTKDSIENAIKKGTGVGKDDIVMHEVYYEGYAPHGVALIIKAVTDNPTRTVSHVRHIFSKHGGVMGESGTTMFLFEKKGMFTVEAWKHIEEDEQLYERIIDAGIEDVQDTGELTFFMTCPPQKFAEVLKNLTAIEGIVIEEGEIGYVPKMHAGIDEHAMMEIHSFLELMEDNDDIDTIYSTM